MAKVVVSRPGERVVSEITALVKRPASPSVAQAPHIGLVQIGEIQPTELIPGPPGAQGPRGSRWYTGDGPPGSIPGTVTGDMYLDNLTDAVWAYNGTAWVDTGTNIHGSPDTGLEILAKLAPVDGAGSGLDADLLDSQHGAYYLDWLNQTGKPATFPPTLPIPWTDVSGKPATFPPAAHQHPFTDVTGTLTDAQHGNRAGGALHALATAAAAGFMVDAPNDGVQYVRKNVAWAPVSVPPGTAMSDSPPANPLPGAFWFETDTGNLFLWFDDGSSAQWVQVNIAPPTSVIANQIVTYYTASGTHVYDPRTRYATVEVQGPGAGGGGAALGTAGQSSAGSGGGGGGYTRKLIQIAALGITTASITIGSPGVGVVNAAGTAGGASTYNDGVQAITGNGGAAGNYLAASGSTLTTSGSNYAGASGGEYSVYGGPGLWALSMANCARAGFGGNAFLGHGAFSGGVGTSSAQSSNGGNAPVGFGGGGAGGFAINAGAAASGGNGAGSVIIITENF